MNDNIWISVKDRLPEKSGKYLVYQKEEGCYEFHNVTYYSAKWELFNAYDNIPFEQNEEFCFDDVVAWAYLPEPYKGD